MTKYQKLVLQDCCLISNTKVIDSRANAYRFRGNFIRRRRKCLTCGRRFTTTEIISSTQEWDQVRKLISQIDALTNNLTQWITTKN